MAAIPVVEPVETTPQWRRVHPLTPVLRTWGGLAALMTYLVWQGSDVAELQQLPGQLGGHIWLALGTLLSIIAVIGAFSIVAWRFTAYALDTAPGGTGSVYFREGIVFRKQRQARLARIQAVDIRRSLIARLFGLSQLTCEVAGGADSAVTIGFLRADHARALREEILALARQYRETEDDGLTTGVDLSNAIGSEDEQPLYRVPTSRLVASVALSIWGVVAALIVLVVIVVFIIALVAGPGGAEVLAVLQGGALVSLIPVFAAVVWGVFQQVNRQLDFRATLTPDGVRLHRGLTETRAQTIPPARIQAISLHQPIFWRPFDWWRVTMTVAGYGRESDAESRSVLLPVGTRQEAFTALWSVLPQLGTYTPELLINEGMDGFATGDFGSPAFIGSPRQTWVLDPISWRRRGLAVTENALLVRRGRFNRTLEVVPRNRTQSIALHQGPIQRALGVASIAAHVPPGPVAPIAQHLDIETAAQVLAEITG